MEDLDDKKLKNEIDEIMKSVDQVVENLDQQGFGEKKEEEPEN